MQINVCPTNGTSIRCHDRHHPRVNKQVRAHTMDPQRRRLAITLGCVGFGLAMLATSIDLATNASYTMMTATGWVGGVMFFVAVALYCHNKGYGVWLGLLGLLGPLGAVIAAKLPDRTRSISRSDFLSQITRYEEFFHRVLKQHPGWDWAEANLKYLSRMQACLMDPVDLERCRRVGNAAQQRFRRSHPNVVARLGRDLVAWADKTDSVVTS